MHTDTSVLSISIGASIMLEKRITRKKMKIKSLSTSPPRNDSIPNQDKNPLGIKKDQILPPHVPKFPPGFKSLRNKADDDHHESIDTSCTDKDYTSRTDKDDSMKNLRAMKNKNDDDKYKEENSQHQQVNESVINKNKEEESLLKRLMFMNFQQKVVQYVICTVTLCGG